MEVVSDCSDEDMKIEEFELPDFTSPCAQFACFQFADDSGIVTKSAEVPSSDSSDEDYQHLNIEKRRKMIYASRNEKIKGNIGKKRYRWEENTKSAETTRPKRNKTAHRSHSPAV
ncbi:unnamed protein product [Caenorhabditis sp. 36 PRJEB53466]|nr:unnamed protein product [Caenorhabditis sp. 36 PRJEB53466]